MILNLLPLCAYTEIIVNNHNLYAHSNYTQCVNMLIWFGGSFGGTNACMTVADLSFYLTITDQVAIRLYRD